MLNAHPSASIGDDEQGCIPQFKRGRRKPASRLFWPLPRPNPGTGVPEPCLEIALMPRPLAPYNLFSPIEVARITTK